ncbi:hypothetical protein PE36_00439 [Moritella sp. PE36]|uniref:O-antigen ligase family protein n=1 Tax=Moritella sp. PE36 TaxID=58051 RepID=UPI00015680E7|nr:O-antigen ligase family protein [Moritella sp. PE36]EDM67447.1 hypothetical protein PE36_00439 [Moritella sp. PE36]
MQNFIFYNICAVIFYAPIPLGANRIWASSSIEFWIFAIFIFHLMTVVKRDKPLLPPRYSLPVLIPLTVTCVWLLLQVLAGLSLDPTATQLMLLKTLALTLLAWLICCYVTDKKTVYQFALALFLAGVYQGIYASWLNLSVGSPSPVFGIPYGNRANGTFVYQNQLANYLALTLSIGIGILISQLSYDHNRSRLRDRIRALANILLSAKMVIRLGLIIMFIGLILTRSRMGNSAFFMALAAVSLLALFIYNNPPKNLKLLIISFFVLDLILIGSIFGVEKIKQRLVETSLASETRDEVVRDALPMIQDQPIFGSGGGSFYSSFPRYHPEVYSGFYDHAHNDYIQFAVELGLPITLMLGGMMLYCLLLSVRTMKTRRTPLFQGIAFGSCIAILHMLLHSTVDFSLQSPAIAVMFVSILSLSLVVGRLNTRSYSQNL